MKGKKMDTAPKFPTPREEFAGELTPNCTGGPVSAKHTNRFRQVEMPTGTDHQKPVLRIDR